MQPQDSVHTLDSEMFFHKKRCAMDWGIQNRENSGRGKTTLRE